jgi:hypothetical protein
VYTSLSVSSTSSNFFIIHKFHVHIIICPSYFTLIFIIYKFLKYIDNNYFKISQVHEGYKLVIYVDQQTPPPHQSSPLWVWNLDRCRSQQASVNAKQVSRWRIRTSPIGSTLADGAYVLFYKCSERYELFGALHLQSWLNTTFSKKVPCIVTD